MIDKAAYQRDVLDPARRAGGARPEDLFVRYGLDPARRPDADAFRDHVEQMRKYWRTLTQKRLYARLAEALIADHQELAEARKLTWEAFQAVRTGRKTAAETQLKRQIEALASTTPCVSAPTVRHLAGDVWEQREVRDRLVEAGLRVVDPLWELPAPPPGHRALREQLALLRLRLSVELVFGQQTVARGFRLRNGFLLNSGKKLTDADVRKSADEGRSRPRDDRQAAADGVLSILKTALDKPGMLDAQVLWEIAEMLRPSVEAGLPVGMTAAEAVALGLDRTEAEDLALALAEQRSGGTEGGVRAEVEEALASGALRAAERLLPRLGADDAHVRAQVEQAVGEVARISAEAAAHLSAGRSEDAAEALARAARLAADDDELSRRLAAIPPPPAGRVWAAVDGGRVAVSWTPGDVRVGPVSYRVVRTVGAPAASASAGTRIGDVTGNEAADPLPPVAVQAYYTVFVRRADGVWSPPASAPSVRCLPEVSDPTVTATVRAVRVGWTAHPDLAEAEVTRLGAGTREITATRDGFCDDQVKPGQSYLYRIRAVYRVAGGTTERSAGIQVTATPEVAPQPVKAITVTAQGPGTALVRWRRPAGGRVVIRSASTPPTWAEGDTVTATEASRHGAEVPGAPADDGDWSTLTATIGGSRRFFTATTVGGTSAVIGPTASIKIIKPVHALSCRRLGDKAVVAWEWPDGATTATVVWTPTGGLPQTSEISKRAFTDNGGYPLKVGASGGTVAVRVTDQDGAETAASPTVQAQVPQQGIRVRYEFHRRHSLPFRPALARLRLCADEVCDVPDLIVVHSAGPTLPLRPGQGQIIHRVPATRMAPGLPIVIDLSVPRSRTTWLVCFADGEATDSVILKRVKGTW